MGGGDLNMKKHFHPLTMQNLERVWKAEQKAKDEAEKLEQLQRELEEERRREALQQHAVEQGIAKKKSEKLSWMYAGPQVNHEDYLLGKRIDKNNDILKEAADNAKEETVGASFISDYTSDPVKDMSAKIKEDPLFLIKKKEDESKKELIKNPIKLRKLKEMLNISVNGKHEKRKHKKDKHRKHKKEKLRERISVQELHKKQHKEERNKSSCSESDITEDETSSARKSRFEERRSKRPSISTDEEKERSKSNHRSKKARYHRDDCGDDIDKRKAKHKKRPKYSRNIDGMRRRSPSDSEGKEFFEKSGSKEGIVTNKYGLVYPLLNKAELDKGGKYVDRDTNGANSFENHKAQSMDKPSLKHRSECHSRSNIESDLHKRKRRKHSKIHNSANKQKINDRDFSTASSSGDECQRDSTKYKRPSKNRNVSTNSDSDSPHCSKGARKEGSNRKEQPPRMFSNNISRKLNADELERRRKGMMENAKWRDDQRGKNVTKYKLEDEKEEKNVKKQLKSFDRESKAKFIHDMQVKSYSSSSTASVEDRIKRNIYTKQRTQAAFNKKFTEK